MYTITVYADACSYIYIYLYINILFTFTQMYIYIYMCIYIYTHIYVYKLLFYTNACMNSYMYIYIYICIYVLIYFWLGITRWEQAFCFSRCDAYQSIALKTSLIAWYPFATPASEGWLAVSSFFCFPSLLCGGRRALPRRPQQCRWRAPWTCWRVNCLTRSLHLCRGCVTRRFDGNCRTLSYKADVNVKWTGLIYIYVSIKKPIYLYINKHTSKFIYIYINKCDLYL